MSNLIKDIPHKYHSEFLEDFFLHYVHKQGLGGIPKPDLDALIIYLYSKYSKKEFDSFSLGQTFMIKESKVKSLYETGLIKYSSLTESLAWIEILTKLESTKFELESNEKSQIKFKFENPALYKFFQKRLRYVGGTASYSNTYEIVKISLGTFFELLDHIYDESQTNFKTIDMEKIHPLIKSVINQVGISLGERKLNELKGEAMKTKAGKALTSASNLSGIGSFIVSLV